MVITRPTGAQLFVDDRLVGTTPLLVSGVAAGPHSIRLEADGFPAWSGSVVVEADKRLRLERDLGK
jgi:hypothetical protein